MAHTSPQQQRRLSLKFPALSPTRTGQSRIPTRRLGSPVSRPSDARAAPPEAETISTHVITDLDGLQQLLRRATERRATCATASNDHSSRSHFLCVISVRGSHPESGAATNGVLNMVDLAGSERLSKSGAVGDQLKETQHINKSLFCLHDVITAISSNARFIPFRNSKLTWLLRDSLSNNAKVMTLVTLSPTLDAQHETLCSLRFASKAHSCELGQAKRDVNALVAEQPKI